MKVVLLSVITFLIAYQTAAKRIHNSRLKVSGRSGLGGSRFQLVNNAVQLSNTIIDDSERLWSITTCTKPDGNLQGIFLTLSASPYLSEAPTKTKLD